MLIQYSHHCPTDCIINNRQQNHPHTDLVVVDNLLAQPHHHFCNRPTRVPVVLKKFDQIASGCSEFSNFANLLYRHGSPWHGAQTPEFIAFVGFYQCRHIGNIFLLIAAFASYSTHKTKHFLSAVSSESNKAILHCFQSGSRKVSVEAALSKPPFISVTFLL